MKNINDYLIESANKKEKSKAYKSFQDYFDNFDFNSIPASERNKDVEDYEDIAKASKMATEASLEDDVIIESNNNGEIKSVSQVVEELKVKYNMRDYQFRVYNPFEVQIVTVDQIPNYLESYNSVLMQFILNNVDIIKWEMERCGYYTVREEVHTDKETNRKWVFLMFDPIRQEDISTQIKNNCTTLYHCSPSKNHNLIMEKGILPQNESRVYTYNSKRVYLLTTDPKSDSFKTMMSNITKNRKKKESSFDEKYYVYWIDVDELGDISFYYDAHGRNSIFTNSPIPTNAIIKSKEIQF